MTTHRSVPVLRGLVTAAAVLLLASACSGASGQTGSTAAAGTSNYVGHMTLDPVHGLPGTQVKVRGEGLPPNTDLELSWETADGHWDIQGDANEEYHGQVYTSSQTSLGKTTVDSAGNLDTSFVVPDGFGFGHDVSLVDGSGTVRNKALFNVDMQVTVSPTSGPPGTPITIEVRGMGWQTMENNRQLLYDNNYAGWLSAVTTHGTARAVIPATGATGPHHIEVARGAYTFPYLNPAQSPRPDIPTFDATFTVTDGDPVLPAPWDQQSPAPRPRSAGAAPSGTWVSTDMAAGPVGTPLTISGAGFSPGASLDLVWYRIVGNRVSGNGWGEQSLDLGSVTAGSDGSLSSELEVPGDVGGKHRIEVRSGDQVLAETSFVVTPAADALSPERGPFGTEITLHLTGVGWTETANIYTIVYDNSYIGYACGFNSQGDVIVPLTATGAPGWHFIDLYPAIYKGKETAGQQTFRTPQLTAADDHPGEDLPVFHYAFYLEG